MTRIIEFDHTGHLIRAIAIFNFAKDSCSVMVLPIEGKYEFGDITLIKTGREWTTESKIKSTHGLTFSKLLHEIDSAITQHEVFTYVDAQRLLS